eukprot:537132-Alexandrium_andersonii.AAC.1
MIVPVHVAPTEKVQIVTKMTPSTQPSFFTSALAVATTVLRGTSRKKTARAAARRPRCASKHLQARCARGAEG